MLYRLCLTQFSPNFKQTSFIESMAIRGEYRLWCFLLNAKFKQFMALFWRYVSSATLVLDINPSCFLLWKGQAEVKTPGLLVIIACLVIPKSFSILYSIGPTYTALCHCKSRHISPLRVKGAEAQIKPALKGKVGSGGFLTLRAHTTGLVTFAVLRMYLYP